MKLLVVSDVESKFIWDHFDREYFNDVDLMLSCGDLSAQYLSFLVTMLPRPLLYVPGNHDKKYIDYPPLGCVNIDCKLAKVGGLHILGVGGCKSPRGLLHEYTDRQMWAKIRKLEPAIRRMGGIDIFVSHAPALGLGDGPDSFHEGFEAFRYLLDTYHPAYHFYGHVHRSHSPVDRRAFFPYGDTIQVNTTGYKIINIPDQLPRHSLPRQESLLRRIQRNFDKKKG